MERALLVRHGEAEHNTLRRVNGDPTRTVRLTARGRDEARLLAETLRDQAVDLCVVTEFGRTHETADLALEGRDVPRLVVPALDDPRFGDLEWHPIDEVRAFVADHGPTTALPGGGESRVETIRRYCDGFSLVADRPEPVALVVAHGLPVTAVWLAAHGGEVPLSLHGVPDAHAEAHPLGLEELLRGVARMGEWVRKQEEAAA